MARLRASSTLPKWWRRMLKKGTITIVFVLILTILMFIFMVISATAAGVAIHCEYGDICVNTSGWWRDGGTFNASNTPIQHAINNVTEGETICVSAGTYVENVKVNKSLTIRSENGSAFTTVQALNSNDHVFNLTADYVNISGFTVTGATGFSAGIYLSSVNHCNVYDNHAVHNKDGIYLYYSSNNTLINNTASDRYYGAGIYLVHSSYNTLISNIASTNEIGIYLSYSSNNTLSDNVALHSECGIYLSYSSNNTLSNNNASNNLYEGIYLSYSSNNTLTNNIVNSNGRYSIYLRYASSNTLTSNTASDNYGYGIYLSSSSNNLIHNNYFNNTNNAYDDGNNLWNTTKTKGTNIIGGPWLGGNYWSDYVGEDLDGDGLGDTPYSIAGGGSNNNTDYLPLVVKAKTSSPCFIATAAYGTPLYEDIDVLRDFRDEHLMTHPIGRTFVKIYYATSPPIAAVIRENEGLRTIVRVGMVKPLVYILKLFVE